MSIHEEHFNCLADFNFFLAVVLLLAGCTFENEETLFKDVVCPEITELVSYSGFVKPLLEKRCISCHSSILSSGNVNLENYEKLKVHVENNEFLAAIRHTPEIGRAHV